MILKANNSRHSLSEIDWLSFPDLDPFPELGPCFQKDSSLQTTTDHWPRHHNKETNTMLPPDFKPSPYTVIVGRRKEFKYAPGNLRLRELARSFLSDYCEAEDKLKKSTIVTKIIVSVEEACPNGGAFVKKGADGRWIELNDHDTREKVGYVLRDLLHNKYQSSSKSRTVRRRGQKKTTKANSEIAVEISLGDEQVLEIGELSVNGVYQQGTQEETSVSLCECCRGSCSGIFERVSPPLQIGDNSLDGYQGFEWQDFVRTGAQKQNHLTQIGIINDTTFAQQAELPWTQSSLTALLTEASILDLDVFDDLGMPDLSQEVISRNIFESTFLDS